MEELFNVDDHVIVTNPTGDRFKWLVGGERWYEIEPGQTKRLHGSAAKLYVKHMVDKILIAENRVTDLRAEAARKEISERVILKIIGADDAIVDTEVDHDLIARKNDIAPAQEADEFPTLKQEPEQPKEVKSDAKPAEPKAKPSKPATK